MSDAPIIEHDPQPIDDQQADPGSAPLAIVAEPEPEQITPVTERRALVPVGPAGAMPATLQQQIDFAQSMAKAVISLPTHLRGNVGDCLAVLDIASRAGLSPYMVANKTYLQNDRLCFESQLFHALLVQSGKLKGDLQVSYQGEGDERTCTIKGTLRSDGIERTHTSLKLKDARPGTNDRGQIKGSPLWKDKPDVQQFYDTSRDWIRMFAPTATLGIFTPEELIEHPLGPEGAITVGGIDSSLHSRLKGTDRSEGHQPGHAEAELAQVAAGGRSEIKPAAPTAKRQPAAQPAKSSPRAVRRAKRAGEAVKPTAAAAPKEGKNGQKGAKTPQPQQETGGAEAKSPVQQRAERDQAAAPNGQPKTPVEYWGYARNWILAGKSADDLEARWDGERDLRDELGVLLKNRKELEKLLASRVDELRPKA